mmetsp:Transcript_951/g.2247  ORF Transcript_951/g.2247 Transcript_951/m.2247 type:complete len:270 (+) Transcript_951:173-982(+)
MPRRGESPRVSPAPLPPPTSREARRPEKWPRCPSASRPPTARRAPMPAPRRGLGLLEARGGAAARCSAARSLAFSPKRSSSPQTRRRTTGRRAVPTAPRAGGRPRGTPGPQARAARHPRPPLPTKESAGTDLRCVMHPSSSLAVGPAAAAGSRRRWSLDARRDPRCGMSSNGSGAMYGAMTGQMQKRRALRGRLSSSSRSSGSSAVRGSTSLRWQGSTSVSTSCTRASPRRRRRDSRRGSCTSWRRRSGCSFSSRARKGPRCSTCASSW